MVRFMMIGVIAALCAMGGARVLTSIAANNNPPQPSAAVATVAPEPQSTESGEASIAKSTDGHFWANAEVDGHPVRFLVDTGATAVALTADDARNVSTRPRPIPVHGDDRERLPRRR